MFFAALAVRAAAIAPQFSSFDHDPDGYRKLAITWRTTGTFGFASHRPGEATVRPTAFRPPLYPLVLAALVDGERLPPIRVAWLHALLGAATTAVVFLLALQAGLGRGAFLAAGMTAGDPILLRQSALIMTETLAAFLAAVGLLALARFDRHPTRTSAALAGGLFGLATLCRPTFVFWLALVTAAALMPWGNRPPRRLAAVLVLSAAATLAPWALRNFAYFGRPILTTTHGGYTLWLGNNDLYYDHLSRRSSGTFDAERLLPQLNHIRAGHEGDEIAADRALQRAAIAVIERRPMAFVGASARRVADLWRLTPRPTPGSESTRRTLARLAVGVWYGVAFLLAAHGVALLGQRLRRPPWWGAVWLCLAFTAVHTVYWTDMRMRAPLVPAIALAAAAGARWPLRRKSLWRKTT